jgi:hypothetical protein
MKTIQEKLLERINQLLEKAEKVKATDKYPALQKQGYVSVDALDNAMFLEWKSNVENLIILIAGKDSVYYQNFINMVKYECVDHVNYGIGILKALKEDIEQGYLTNIKNLVVTEVFSDFLDMAEHLLENGYKEPAASLIGAVLEDGLRKIAEKNNIIVKRDDNISSLNQKLADKGIYNRLVQRQIQVWEAIRNSADHGKFNDYKLDDVKLMLEGVKNFLTEHL